MANENFDINNTTGNVNIDDMLGGDDFDYSQFGEEPDEDSLENLFYERLFDAIDGASRNIDGVIYLLDHCDCYDFDEETAELKIIRKNVNHIFERLNNIMIDYGEE